LLGVVLFLCFFVRFFPRFMYPNALVSDTYFHLHCSRIIRNNHFRLPKQLPRITLKHEYTYPFGYHYLLALFPERQRLWLEKSTGAIFDTISSIIVYFFSSLLVKSSSLSSMSALPLITTTLFAFSPGLLRLGSGPRAYNGSPRPIGQTLYLLHLYFAYYSYVQHSISLILISIITGSLLIITAKFGNQVLILFGVIFSFFIHQYLIILILTFIVSILLTKGNALVVLKGQVNHSIFYFKYMQAIFLWPNFKNLSSYIKNIANLKGLKNSIVWFYTEQYSIHLIFTVFFLYVYCIFYLLIYGMSDSNLFFLVIWSLIAFSWFILTKTKFLAFLGEGERYLEYALFPTILLFVIFSYSNTLLIVFSLVYSSIASIFYVCYYLKVYGPTYDNAYKESEIVIKHLKDLKSGVIWPIGSFHFEILYRSSFDILTHAANIDEHFLKPDEFKLVYGNYPYPSQNYDDIIQRFNIKYIYSNQLSFYKYQNEILKTPNEFNKDLMEIIKTPNYILYQVIKH